MHHRHRLLVALALMCCIGIAACGGSSKSGSSSGSSKSSSAPIDISLISIQIPTGQLLDSMQAGANAALSQIASQGGWGGRKVQLNTCNSQAVPSVAVDCAHSTLADHPVAMVGCDPVWVASGLPVYEAAKVPSINCLGTPQEASAPYSYGINPSSDGQQAAMMRYLCTRSDVHNVAIFTYNLPSEVATVESTTKPILTACHKNADYIFYSNSGIGSMTPYIAKMQQDHADFVVAENTGAEAVEVMKALAQADLGGAHLAFPDTSLTLQTVQSAGPASNGVYSMGQYVPWGYTSNPEVAAYLKAMGSSQYTKQANSQWGYQYIMFLYTVAKKVGFSNFSAATLNHYLLTANNIPVSLAKPTHSPGPKGWAHMLQSKVFLSQIQSGKFVAVDKGTDGGWVQGLSLN